MDEARAGSLNSHMHDTRLEVVCIRCRLLYHLRQECIHRAETTAPPKNTSISPWMRAHTQPNPVYHNPRGGLVIA